MTSEGFIPHLSIGKYQLPVMINVKSPKQDEYHAPLRVHGDLAYALPAGKIFSSKA
jgi:hypothetical protein